MSSPQTQTTTPAGPKNQYNILFVLTDQERYISREQTPSTLNRSNGLERLQQRGITFQNHQINSVACSSSRSNLYTGQHITTTGIFDNVNFPWQSDLSSTKIKTMGHLLREHGYKTAYKGKWHLTNSYDRPYQEGSKSLSLEQYGFSDWHGITDGIHHALGGHHFDSLTVGSAIQWLRSTGATCQQEGTPWLLAVNLVNPHDIMFFDTDDADGSEKAQQQGKHTIAEIKKAPHHKTYQTQHPEGPLPQNWKQSLEEEGRPKAHKNYSEIYDHMVGNVPTSGQDGEERMKRYKDYYYNCIQDMDDNLAMLLDQLDATGMSSNTIVIYTSDHGELGGAHGMRGKGSCSYREQNNVPLVIVHPAFDHNAGKCCKAITSHIDILPTMLAAAAATAASTTTNGTESYEKNLPGHDLTKLLADPEGAKYDTIRPNGALFTYNMLITVLPPSYVHEAATKSKQVLLGRAGSAGSGKEGSKDGSSLSFLNAVEGSSTTNKNNHNYLRGAIRTIYDGRYKYSRYFFPKRHNTPNSTLGEILQYNDIELFDHETDPNENHNLAATKECREQNRKIIEQMNTKMNRLIQEEIGQDNGQMLPFGKTIINWSIQPKALATM